MSTPPTWTTQQKKIADLKPAKYNPRKLTAPQKEHLTTSLTRFNLAEPIVVNQNNVIIGGHQRIKVLREMGRVDVDVSVPDRLLNDDEEKELNLRLNKNTGEWDFDLLKDFSPELLTDVGFESPELNKIFPTTVEERDDQVPEAPEEPTTKPGDLYLLGPHRLLCGDSTRVEDVERLMDGKTADMVFTDPPYNLASDSKNFAKDVSKSMKRLSESEWDKDFNIENFVNLLPAFSGDSCTYYIWSSHFLIGRIWDALKNFCNHVNYMVWDKLNPMPSLSKRHPAFNTELCAYATRGSHRIVNYPKEGHFLSCRSVVKKSDGTHPTQKPLDLIIPFINFSSGCNQIIADPFLGSGSTLIACEKTNRICFGMEIDPKYCDVIVKRWENFTGKKATLAS